MRFQPPISTCCLLSRPADTCASVCNSRPIKLAKLTLETNGGSETGVKIVCFFLLFFFFITHSFSPSANWSVVVEPFLIRDEWVESSLLSRLWVESFRSWSKRGKSRAETVGPRHTALHESTLFLLPHSSFGQLKIDLIAQLAARPAAIFCQATATIAAYNLPSHLWNDLPINI